MTKKLILITFFFNSVIFAQKTENPCEILYKINSLLQEEHVLPKPLNDNLSIYVFDQLFDKLDPARNIFLKSEYELLKSKYQLEIDDAIRNKNCDFLSEIWNVYKVDVLRNKIILEKIAQNPLNFNQKDTVKIYKNQFPFYLKEKDVEKVWNKKIRFEVLNQIISEDKNLNIIKNNFSQLTLEAQKNCIENELCKINAILGTNENINPDLIEDVYNFFCNYFDPHTSYFSNNTKSTFVASLSKEHLSLGLSVALNAKNEMIINDIVPNGPAALNGLIKKGDKIISISNQKETIAVSCSSLENIANLIQSDENKIITLNIQNKAGKTLKTTLEKQFLTDQENTVYSFVINQKVKTGYIKIPRFYSDFDQQNNVGVAEDVMREITKLQEDGIKGLVLDLTDNGGGSMEEALKMIGIFIDEGPISIVMDKNHNPTIVENPSKKMYYKDPVVILLNSNSASASEFFAGTMQDYKRAILIGSATLGKSTMQKILALASNDNRNFVKVTINKFYRITGKSHQGLGVIPDVELPEIYESVYQKESNFSTAFKNDTIKVDLKHKNYFSENIKENLTSKSLKRVLKNEYFNEIKKINTKVKALTSKEKSVLPITLDNTFKEKQIVFNLWKEINKSNDKITSLKVANSDYDKALLNFYTSKKEINQEEIENLKKNHYLNEAVNIIQDFTLFK